MDIYERWEYVGKRHYRYEGGGREDLHVVAVPHQNGPWEAIRCKTEEQARAIVNAQGAIDRVAVLEQALLIACENDQRGAATCVRMARRALANSGGQ